MATSWSSRCKSGRGTIETRDGALRVADPGPGVPKAEETGSGKSRPKKRALTLTGRSRRSHAAADLQGNALRN
jgi:hypothetical protein